MHINTDTRIDYAALLRRVGLKVTRCRVAMLAYIDSQGQHATADEITAGLKAEGFTVDRVTIYRNVDRMLQKGLLATIYVPGRAMRVGLCKHPDSAHHHHVVCVDCGKVEEVESCFLTDSWDQVCHEVNGSSGYELTGHVMQYLGKCPECARTNGRMQEPTGGRMQERTGGRMQEPTGGRM